MTAGQFDDVLRELAAEHAGAIERHGFDHVHDDAHDDQTWAWYLLRRVSELLTPADVLVQSPAERRRHLLEVAHIAASAVASHDRRIETGGIIPGDDVGWTPLPSPASFEDVPDEPDLVAAPGKWYPTVDGPLGEGVDCLLVARRGVDQIERHAVTCRLYRPGPGITCTGACFDLEETAE